MEFEWDEQKRVQNLEKHGYDFRRAVVVFDSEHIILPSGHAGEERYLAVGLLEGRFVTVVFTWRNERCRVISMRRSRENERRAHQAVYG